MDPLVPEVPVDPEVPLVPEVPVDPDVPEIPGGPLNDTFHVLYVPEPCTCKGVNVRLPEFPS